MSAFHKNQRREIRRLFRGHKRVDREHPKDQIALLLPYGYALTAAVHEMAADLGASEIIENPWPDRLTRTHMRAQQTGLDISVPTLWVERWTEPDPDPGFEPGDARKEIERLRAELSELSDVRARLERLERLLGRGDAGS